MNIFNSILQKLGIQKPAAAPAPAAPAAGSMASIAAAAAPVAPAAPAPTPSVSIGVPAAPVTAEFTTQAPEPAPAIVEPESFSITPDPEPVMQTAMPMVDVVSMLEDLGKSHPGADWKVSINDLLMMLGFEHSYEYRKELAAELGCPEDLMSDSARMNVWLHKTVLQKISENGGNIPSSLLS